MSNKIYIKILPPFLVILFNLSLHIYLASHTRFISDDYCTAAMAKKLGILRATWYWYLNWSGRFSASMLDSLFGLLGPKTTSIAIPIFILLWLGVLTMTIRLYISNGRRNLWHSLLLGANVIFLTFLLSHDIRQSIYWGQGMRSILPPMILITLYIGLYQWLQTRGQVAINLLFWLPASFLFAFIVGGFSESFVSLQVILFSTALFFVLLSKNNLNKAPQNYYLLISGLVGTILALIVMLAAPGNAIRQAQLPPAPDFTGILSISIESFFVFLQDLVASVDKFLGILGCLGIGLFIGYQNAPQQISNRTWFLLPLVAFGFIFVCFPPAAYGLSDAPPGRTLILPVYIFSITVIILGYMLGNWLHRFPEGLRAVRSLSMLTIVTFAVSNYLTDMNLFHSRNIFIEFADKWDKQNALILKYKSANSEQAIVPTMDDVNWAGATTIHARPKFWLNQCVSQYYGIETIAIDTP